MLIMSDLQQNVQLSASVFVKMKNLQKLIKLDGLLFKFIGRASDNAQVDTYKAYFAKDITLFILTLTCEDRSIPIAMKVPILHMVQEMLKRTVVQCPDMFRKNLNRMVALLVQLAMANKEEVALGEKIADLLKYFHVDLKSILGDVLDKIDILPEDHPALEYASTLQVAYSRDTIRGECERYLAMPKRSVHCLKYLRKRIQEHEREFLELFKTTSMGPPVMMPDDGELARELVLALLRCIKEGSAEVC